MWENADQNNSEYVHFLRSVTFLQKYVCALRANIAQVNFLYNVFLSITSLCKVVHRLWVNIAQVIFLCSVGTGRSRQYWIGCFPAKTCLCALRQHCTSNFLVQCCFRLIWTTLHRNTSCSMLP